eukprot:8371427-Ditylum_brightwellii.AAC.1
MEARSSFYPPVIPFVPKATTLKAGNAQDFSLHMTISNTDSIYKYMVFNFANGTSEDVLEWGKKDKQGEEIQAG